MLRAWILGIGMLIAPIIIWLALIQAEIFSWPAAILLQSSPFFSAFIAAYLAPYKKMHLAIYMGISAAFLLAGANFIWNLFGNTSDFPGISGSFDFFKLMTIVDGVLCLLSGSIGYFSSKKRRTA